MDNRTKRRVRPDLSWFPEIDCGAPWNVFEEKCYQELLRWLDWCLFIADPENARLVDKVVSVEPFPMLSRVRFWWKKAVKIGISKAQMTLETSREAKIRDGTIDHIILLLTGKTNKQQDPNGPPRIDIGADLDLRKARPITPLLLWDFTRANFLLCFGQQSHDGLLRKGGHIQANVANQRMRSWREEQKAKGKYKAGDKPPRKICSGDGFIDDVRSVIINWMGTNHLD